MNAPFVPPEEWGVLAPYIKLGRQLGALCTGMIQEPVRAYELEYRGELAGVETAPVRLAVLQGLLAGVCEQRVTPVNAPLLARERGLKYSEHSSSEAESYAGLLVLRAETADGPHEFAGTVLRDEPHVVQADGYWVDFVPHRAAAVHLPPRPARHDRARRHAAWAAAMSISRACTWAGWPRASAR